MSTKDSSVQFRLVKEVFLLGMGWEWFFFEEVENQLPILIFSEVVKEQNAIKEKDI